MKQGGKRNGDEAKNSTSAKTARNFVFATLIFSAAAASGPTKGAPDDNFNETLAICTTLDMYGVMALKGREVGMPLDMATGLLADSMNKNLANLPEGMRSAYIDVAKDLYRRVYEDKSIRGQNMEQAIIASCSKYKGYDIDVGRLEKELSVYVQSAFDPFRRVHICQKAGETAANIAVARDKGVPKEKIVKVATGALENDQRTREIVPVIADEVYAFSDVHVPSFYLYNVMRCSEKLQGRNIVAMKDAKAGVVACQKSEDQKARAACLSGVYSGK